MVLFIRSCVFLLDPLVFNIVVFTVFFWKHPHFGLAETFLRGGETKTKKKPQNRALKFEKHAKTMKNFFWNFLLELWRKHFWESWNSSASSDSSFVEIVFKLIFSPEDEIAKLFESTKHKCLHILFSDGIYFWKRNLFKNQFLLKKLNPKTNFTLNSKYITLRDSVLCFV